VLSVPTPTLAADHLSAHQPEDLVPSSMTLPSAVFEAAFDGCALPQALVCVDGTFRRVNPALAALLGYPVEDLTGLRYQDLTPSEDAPLDAEGTRRLAEREQARGSVEKRLLRRDGQPVWVRVSVTPVWQDDGTPWGGVASIEPLNPDLPSALSDGERAYWLALHDVLTGAANRLLLHDRISLALAACEREDGVVAVMFCDIDHFKEVNDSFGHQRGDHVLTAVVRRLQVTLRPDDTVARIGGDEFVVASHVDSAAHARALRDRVRHALAAPLEVPGDPAMTVGVSVGLAVARGDVDVSQVIAEADRDMYREKTRHRAPRVPMQG
jgi:diguanylate cyclase (GGDEF)-like protein/PAS domain S-box-containing protein